MSEINNLLTNISNIKADIKSAIENKGQNVTDFASYPNAISNIVSGGSKGVYSYDSLENMYVDISNRSNGDIGVVYYNIIDNLTENTTFQEALFPKTVVLSSSTSTSRTVEFRIDPADGNNRLRGTWNRREFYLRGGGSLSTFDIYYTSNDGLTYTLDTINNKRVSSDTIVDFGVTLKFYSSGSSFNAWRDAYGEFIKVRNIALDGIFRHDGTNFILVNAQLNANLESVYNGIFYGQYGKQEGNIVNTNLNLAQLKTRVNLYGNLSNLSLENPQNCSRLFSNLRNIVNVPYINTVDTIDTSYMFSICYNLVDAPNFDTSNVADMSWMFSYCNNLVNVPILNLSNATNISNMFKYCNNLSEFALNNITNFVPNASQIQNVLIYNTGIYSNRFSEKSKDILFNKGYLDCDQNTIGWSNKYNIGNGSSWKTYDKGDDFDRYGITLENILHDYKTSENSSTNTNLTIKSDGVDNGQIFLVSTFSGGTTLKYANIQINTCNVISTESAFMYCYNLINISNFDTSNVADMSWMFYGCHNLTSVPNMNLSNVINMYSMFSDCHNLTTIPNFDISNVVDMYHVFAGCTNLTSVPNFNTPKLLNLQYTFYNCASLVNAPNLETSNVTDMKCTFENCKNLKNISNWNTINVICMNNTFENCWSLSNVPNFDTSNVTNMAGIFKGCNNLTNVPNFNTSNVTNIAAAFYGCNNLTTIPNLDTSNVTNMYSMFYNCYNLVNAPSLNVVNVIDMAWMFQNCTNLVNVPNYDTSNVTDMRLMFIYCYNLKNAPNFDTSSVVSMIRMFCDCNNLVNVPNYNTINVINMDGMFEDCNSLSNTSIQNIINMALNSNVLSNQRNLNPNNSYSPLYNTKFNSSYYSNRLDELTAAGWAY